MKATVFGVGVNDAGYPVARKVNGKQVMCHFYSTWRNMIKRCYCKKYQEIKPTYIGCSVDPEWLTFSNFKRWMEKQDWQGKHLDKDIIISGNKVYSPNSCAFVDQLTNSFIADAAAIRGRCAVGVYFYGRYNKFSANCGNPFTKKREFLGYFDSEVDASNAYLKRKREHAVNLATIQSDERVMVALLRMY